MITLDNINYVNEHQQMLCSLHICAKEQITILGPSGAGKSTLLALIAGFIITKQGTIFLDGINHTRTPPGKRPVSIMFQENNLFPHLNIEKNLGLGLSTTLNLNKIQKNRLNEIAEQIGILNCLHRLPSQISGGQRQRAALARCLLRDQPILLLDEPLSALDPVRRNEILQLLAQVCSQKNITLLMIVHNLDDAARISYRTLLVSDGRFVYDGSTQDLLGGKDPQSASLVGLVANNRNLI
ncbi:thiamine ABC transporter ATP-binding protein ThiQ [Candidatus Profftia tarda]|nr:thiamine ABC transporter ATP-binding protein ThiQ [Candidatus Profftia tarda]